MNKRDIRLVIFDMDGVLVDACEWHRVALNKALREICNYEISLKEHYEIYNGIPTKVKLEKLTDLGVLDSNKQKQVYERKQELTVETINLLADFKPEKVSLIKDLKKQGIKVACYTNSIRETAELMLKKTGVLDELDFLLTNQDVENCKPDPEGYLFLVDKYGFKKDEVLIIEDSPKGKAAAYASGCNVLEVKNPNEVILENIKEYL